MVAVGAAALGAGCVNAIAGGGSLITFPVLVAVGLPPVTASATNTVALCPGYLGATLAQRAQLAGQRARMLRLLPVSAVCGVAGALLLLRSGDAAFAAIVPFLILLAALLLAVQPRISKLIGTRQAREAVAAGSHRAGGADREDAHGGARGDGNRDGTRRDARSSDDRAGGDTRRDARSSDDRAGSDGAWVVVPVALAAVYGGYFGAGMGVMILAALAIAVADSLVRLNALKQAVSLVVNVAAAGVFIALPERVDWPSVGVMLGCALAGGAIGGRIASRVPSHVLRWTVVVLGTGLAIYYFVRLAGA
jgi:uncharacterized membrane protein YfcA